MKTYIATVYSHFGAIRLRKLCDAKGWPAKVMPVPRDLSSSCGTCVQYGSDAPCPIVPVPEEVERIVEVTPQGYRDCYRAQDS